jgi:aldehyde:ferredoxin oxidoreductase
MLGGYLGKILRIRLSREEVLVQELEEADLRRFLGGRGLAAKWYYQEIEPGTEPLGASNKLFFFTGPLTGVPLPSTTKFGVSTKSPETGLYLCSNSGGDFGPRLKFCGFDGLIIEGRAERPTYLVIRDDAVSFHDASHLLGLKMSEVRGKLSEAIGDSKASVLCTGPAAEQLVKFAYIQVDGRAFGRGGPGAVMASKNLKGMVIKGSGEIPLANPERVKEIRTAAIKELRKTVANHTKYGTPQYTEVINELGCYPARNFQSSHLENAQGIYAQHMREHFWARNFACYHCPVACGKVCEVKEGPFADTRARPEFETVGMLGGSCGVTDFAAIIAANELCDEYGIDTISTGNAVALTMELFERGLITKADTQGIEARFGDGQALVEMVKLIGERRGLGDLLAEGMAVVASEKPEWRPYILEVKGMPFAAYDPRGFHGMGLAYGTSSRGACHNVGGWTIRAELLSGEYDRFALKGKGKLVKDIQDNRAYVDSLGLCTVVRRSLGFTENPQGDVLKAVTGNDFTPELMEIGSRIYTLERMILVREGIRRKDDMLPPRIMTEKVPDGPAKGRILTKEMYEVMLDEYYAVRGWDKDGVPTKETLRRLSLNELTTTYPCEGCGMQPFAAQLQFQNGLIEPYGEKTVRRLSDMRGMYLDIAATEELIKQGDPLLYEVYEVDVPHEEGQLIYCTSIIYPGKVGDEYYMTKGHFHSKESTAEMYLGLQGRGYLLMQTHDGQTSAIEMRPGTIAYIPPFWAHRTVNTGDEPFIFFGVYPGDAGHNYGTIEEEGFAKLVVEKNGKPAIVDNPRYRWSRQGARHL